MVEYGQSNIVSKKKERTPPTTLFGISFGEISYLDYDPNTKLKVQQEICLFFSGNVSNVKKWSPSISSTRVVAENVNNKKSGQIF